MDYQQEKIKILRLFIHNLKYHNPTARMPDLIASGNLIKDDIMRIGNAYQSFGKWSRFDREKKLETLEGRKITDECFEELMRMKFLGMVGELIDESSEINRLAKEIINLKEELTRVTNQRDARKQEGIELSDQLNTRLMELAACRKDLEEANKKLEKYEGGKPARPDWRATT